MDYAFRFWILGFRFWNLKFWILGFIPETKTKIQTKMFACCISVLGHTQIENFNTKIPNLKCWISRFSDVVYWFLIFMLHLTHCRGSRYTFGRDDSRLFHDNGLGTIADGGFGPRRRWALPRTLDEDEAGVEFQKVPKNMRPDLRNRPILRIRVLLPWNRVF